MTWVVVLVVVVVVYLAGVLVYGRVLVEPRYHAEISRVRAALPEMWSRDPVRMRGDVRREAVGDAFLAALVWPLHAPIRSAARWMAAPVDEHEQKVARLRADADAWERQRRHGPPEQQAMAVELARLCRERADELDR